MKSSAISVSRRLFSVAAIALAAGFSVSAHAEQTLKVSPLPEEAATEQIRKFEPLANYLSKAIGMKVEFTPVSDYPAAVEALANKKVDLVWLGGFTHIQASRRSGGKVIPIAQRVEDTKFQSVFIAKTDSGIKSLQDMKGKQVSFGSQSSTSGHLMPRTFLLEAGLEPETAFKRVAYCGAHVGTIASVVSGIVDAAALDITVWKKFVDANKVDTNAVNVFYTTPPYYNYSWTVDADMPAYLRNKIQKALFDLDPAVPEHAEILKLNRATRYIDTKPENYKGLEAAAKSAGLL